jgi:UDP-perosamine 4-acetyltransferase
VLADVVEALGAGVYAVVDPAPSLDLAAFPGAEHWRSDAMIFEHPPESIALINGVGAVPGAASRRRRALYEPLVAAGYTFPTLIHPSAILGRRLQVADAVQVMAGTVIQGGCRLGFGVVVNSRASIDHDCQIDAHAMIAPGVVLCGGVCVGEGAYVGAGSVITQGVSIGAGVLIGAGSVVTADVVGGSGSFPRP